MAKDWIIYEDLSTCGSTFFPASPLKLSRRCKTHVSVQSELRSVISLVENILSGFFLDFEQDL